MVPISTKYNLLAERFLYLYMFIYFLLPIVIKIPFRVYCKSDIIKHCKSNMNNCQNYLKGMIHALFVVDLRYVDTMSKKRTSII